MSPDVFGFHKWPHHGMRGGYNNKRALEILNKGNGEYSREHTFWYQTRTSSTSAGNDGIFCRPTTWMNALTNFVTLIAGDISQG